MLKKKLYLVKREVLATPIQKAATTRGIVYSIELAADTLQPDQKKKKTGFQKK